MAPRQVPQHAEGKSLGMVIAIAVADIANVVNAPVLCCVGSAIAVVASVFVLICVDGCGGRQWSWCGVVVAACRRCGCLRLYSLWYQLQWLPWC